MFQKISITLRLLWAVGAKQEHFHWFERVFLHSVFELGLAGTISGTSFPTIFLQVERRELVVVDQLKGL